MKDCSPPPLKEHLYPGALTAGGAHCACACIATHAPMPTHHTATYLMLSLYHSARLAQCRLWHDTNNLELHAKKNHRRYSPYDAPRSARRPCSCRESACGMERYHPARQKRVDMLGRVGEKAGNENQKNRTDRRRSCAWKKAALLLGGMPTPGKPPIEIKKPRSISRAGLKQPKHRKTPTE